MPHNPEDITFTGLQHPSTLHICVLLIANLVFWHPLHIRRNPTFPIQCGLKCSLVSGYVFPQSEQVLVFFSLMTMCNARWFSNYRNHGFRCRGNIFARPTLENGLPLVCAVLANWNRRRLQLARYRIFRSSVPATRFCCKKTSGKYDQDNQPDGTWLSHFSC